MMSKLVGYQGGPYCEIFAAQGKDPTSICSITGSGIHRLYDRDVRGNIYILEGSPTTNKFKIPKHAKQSLCLVQRYLILQIYLNKGQEFSIEIAVTDTGKNKRRVMLSTSQRQVQVTPLHAKIPLASVCRCTWLNLCLDMASLVGDSWKGVTYKCIDSITITANCRLRRVFSMRTQPADTSLSHASSPVDGEMMGENMVEQIPRQCQLSPDVSQITQVLTMKKIRGEDRPMPDADTHQAVLDLNMSVGGGHNPVASDLFHIAFGYKVASLPPGNSSSDGTNSIRSVRSNCTPKSLAPSINSKSKRPSEGTFHGNTSASRRQTSLHDVCVKQRPFSDTAIQPKNEDTVVPDPAREPSPEGSRHHHIHVKPESGGVHTTHHEPTPGDVVHVSRTYDHTQYTGDVRADNIPQQASGQSTGLRSPHMAEVAVSPRMLTSNTSLQQRDINGSLERSLGEYDSVMDVIGMLEDTTLTRDNSRGREDVVSDKRDAFLFSSPPQSATTRLTPACIDHTWLTSAHEQMRHSRGARLEDDFVVSDDSESSEGVVYERPSRRGEGIYSEGEGSGEDQGRDEPQRIHEYYGNNIREKSSADRRIDQHERDVGSFHGEQECLHDLLGGSRNDSTDSLDLTDVNRHLQGHDGKTDKNSQFQTEHVSCPNMESRSSLRTILGKSNPQFSGNVVQASYSHMPMREPPHVPPSEPQRSYDSRYYQMGDVTESHEEPMLSSLKCVANSSLVLPRRGALHNAVSLIKSPGEKSLMMSGDTTSYSTWKSSMASRQNHEDEITTMETRVSTSALLSPSLRHWGSSSGVVAVNQTGADKLESKNESTGLPSISDSVNVGDNIDLLYDPLLNCYYDPDTGKYYEIV